MDSKAEEAQGHLHRLAHGELPSMIIALGAEHLGSYGLVCWGHVGLCSASTSMVIQTTTLSRTCKCQSRRCKHHCREVHGTQQPASSCVRLGLVRGTSAAPVAVLPRGKEHVGGKLAQLLLYLLQRVERLQEVLCARARRRQ